MSLDTMTLILNRARAGDDESAALAWELVMVDLQKIARSLTRGFQTSQRHDARVGRHAQTYGCAKEPSRLEIARMSLARYPPTYIKIAQFLGIFDSARK